MVGIKFSKPVVIGGAAFLSVVFLLTVGRTQYTNYRQKQFESEAAIIFAQRYPHLQKERDRQLKEK